MNDVVKDVQQYLEVFNLANLTVSIHCLLLTERLAYKILYGGLQEGLIEQIFHDLITLDTLFELLDCGLVRFPLSPSLGGKFNLLLDVGITNGFR